MSDEYDQVLEWLAAEARRNACFLPVAAWLFVLLVCALLVCLPAGLGMIAVAVLVFQNRYRKWVEANEKG